jgi:multiple sugar transport system permease protein
MKINVMKILLTALMFLIGIIFLLPFIWMLSTSFKPEIDVFNFPIEWIPHKWSMIANYKEVWFGKYPFSLYYWNTIKVSVLTTITSVLVSSLAAYGFSKIHFKGRDFIFLLVLMSYMIPHFSIIVPQFIVFKYLGLFNTHIGLILLGSFSAFGTFMLRQFFLSIHHEFIESAKIDGANHLKVFTHIAMPLVRPSLATYAILRFIWTWNDYTNPLIFLKTDNMATLQLAMKKFASVSGAYYSLMMAGAVSAIIPLVIIFIFAQKQVIEGISTGGVKG